MRKLKQRFRPLVESLEGKILLSGPTALAAHVAMVATKGLTIKLVGTFSGSYTKIKGPSTGAYYHLAGSGTLQGRGKFSLTGTRHIQPALIYVGDGRDSFDITLTNAKGTLKLHAQVTIPEQGNPKPAPYPFKIVGGTGIYKGATGQGSGTYTRVSHGYSGTFTLKFH